MQATGRRVLRIHRLPHRRLHFWDGVRLSDLARELITISTAQRLLGVTRRTIYNMVQRGDLTAVKYGTTQQATCRIVRGSVEAYVDRHTRRRLGTSGDRRHRRAG